jgi:hypothetical protein
MMVEDNFDYNCWYKGEEEGRYSKTSGTTHDGKSYSRCKRSSP